MSADDPPFLIMHGDRAPLVPLRQSQLLADALRAAGVPVQPEVIRGAGHRFGGLAVRDRVRGFCRARLQHP